MDTPIAMQSFLNQYLCYRPTTYMATYRGNSCETESAVMEVKGGMCYTNY